MKILSHRALRGPNYYARSPVTYMLLDIGELEELPSDKIPGLADRIAAAIPTLESHTCSPGVVGGFFERLQRGTWAGHIVEHLALELQCLAGMEVSYGKTRETTERGVYAVVYKHRDEACGLSAGEKAVQLLEDLIADKPVDIETIVTDLKLLREASMLGPSTAAMVDEAKRRGIPVRRLNNQSHILLGQGVKQKHLQASMTGQTSALAIKIAADKSWTKRLLADAGISVPRGEPVESVRQAIRVANRIGYPVVIKPLDANHGRGITTDIQNEDEIETAYLAAKKHHPVVIVEKFLVGKDHRLLVIGGKLIAAARRDPAHVKGDGKHSVSQLIDIVNSDPRRGIGHEKVLTRIEVDGNTERMLKVQNLTLDSVPEIGVEVLLKSTANLSTGGTATDVTDEVHPELRFMAERIGRIVGLDIMGIDIVAPHLQAPLGEIGGGIVEVNAGPGLRMHTNPTHGKARNVAGPIIDLMFAKDDNGRIPTVAVTGTNGKTTTVRLIAHVMKYGGGRVGMACTGFVEVENQVIMRGDYSGPVGAQTVVREPTITHAAIEVARGGLLRRGMGLDRVSVGVLLNVGRDHMGEGDIHDLDDLLRLKATVPDAADTAVLNVDDELVATLVPKMRGKVALFSRQSKNPLIVTHAESGGLAVVADAGLVVVYENGVKHVLMPVADIPITFGGKAQFNVENALAAAAACIAAGMPLETVRAGLSTFHATTGQNPGRMNLFDVKGYRCLIDFAHNVPALQALDQVLPFLKPRPDGRILRSAYLAGNRMDEDLRNVGEAIAVNCDELWLHDTDPRGRNPGETALVLADGAKRTMPADKVHSGIDEWPNVEAMFAIAKPGDLLIFQSDDVDRVIRQIRLLQEVN